MSFRSRLAALIFGASAPSRHPRGPRAATVITDRMLTPERRVELREAGRKALDDFMARSPHVAREHHFDAPRFGG